MLIKVTEITVEINTAKAIGGIPGTLMSPPCSSVWESEEDADASAAETTMPTVRTTI
jgi:hypothetical protein